MIGITDVNEPGGRAGYFPAGGAGRGTIGSPGKRSATGGDIPRTAKNPAPSGTGFFLFDAWQFPTLTWGDPTLPSALRRFTSEFGMGSGGTTALSPPGKFCLPARHMTH